MSLGTLTAKAVLDKPSHLYCGSSEPVTGRVVLQYEPGSGLPVNQELFGPIRISVIFHGRLKTKIIDLNHIHRGRVPLFSKTEEIFNGPIRITRETTQSQRFELAFPNRIEPKALTSWNKEDDRFDLSLRQALPPAIKTSSTKFNNRFNAFVEYKISVRVSMADMPVTIVTPDTDEEPSILYEQPKVTRRVRGRKIEFSGDFNVARIPNIRGDPEKPLSRRFRFSNSEKPASCVYEWAYQAPTHIHRGDHARLKLTCKPREGSYPLEITPPQVVVKDYTMKLTSIVHARAPTHILSSPHAVTHTVVATNGGKGLDASFDASSNWTTFLDLPHTYHTPTSFRSISIRQFHHLEINITLSVAGQTAKIQKVIGVTIHAPLELPDDIMEDLPLYEPIEQPPTYGSHTELRFSPLEEEDLPAPPPTTTPIGDVEMGSAGGAEVVVVEEDAPRTSLAIVAAV